MDKFYAQYQVGRKDKILCDSIYNLINQRREVFSRALGIFREKSGDLNDFVYDWSMDEKDILSSFRDSFPEFLKYLIFYSYFDLSYGVYGLRLNAEICKQALREIPPSSAIWAMTPSLLTEVIKYAGGDDKYSLFVKRLLKENRDIELVDFAKRYLSPERPLKVGKLLPQLRFRDLSDTSKIVTTHAFKGKYLLIDIWATWCKPCIDEFPLLLKTYQNKGSRLEYLSISIDNNALTAVNFIRNRFPLPWKSGVAIQRKDILNALMISGIPCTILISPGGKILSYGYDLRGKNLEMTLRKLVK